MWAVRLTHLTSSAIAYKHIQWSETWHKKLPPSTRCALYYRKKKTPQSTLDTTIPGAQCARPLLCPQQGSSRNDGKNGNKWVAVSLPSLAVSAVPCQPSPAAAASLPDATESLSIPTGGGGGGAGSIFRQASVFFSFLFFFLTPNHCVSQPALTVSRHTKTHRRLFFFFPFAPWRNLAGATSVMEYMWGLFDSMQVESWLDSIQFNRYKGLVKWLRSENARYSAIKSNKFHTVFCRLKMVDLFLFFF